MYFSSYSVMSDKLRKSKILGSSNFLSDFIAGFGAEAVSCCLWVPIDVCKEQVQTQNELKATNHKNGFQALTNIFKTRGIAGVYRGYYATLLAFGPWSALNFAFFEQFKSFGMSKNENKDLPFVGFLFFHFFFTSFFHFWSCFLFLKLVFSFLKRKNLKHNFLQLSKKLIF